MAQRWPRRTWNSLLERALFQSEKLHAAARDSAGQMRIVRTRADLRDILQSQDRSRACWPPCWPRKACTAGRKAGKRRPAVRRWFPHGRADALLRQRDRRLSPRMGQGGLTPGPPGSAQAGRKAHLGRLGPCFAPCCRRCAGDGHAARGGVTHRCARHLPRPAQPERCTCPGHCCTGRRDWYRLFPGRRVRSRNRGHCQGHPPHRGPGGVKHVALGSVFDGAIRVPFDTTGLVLITQGIAGGRNE